jgi:hypothetical protein
MAARAVAGGPAGRRRRLNDPAPATVGSFELRDERGGDDSESSSSSREEGDVGVANGDDVRADAGGMGTMRRRRRTMSRELLDWWLHLRAIQSYNSTEYGFDSRTGPLSCIVNTNS